MKQSFEPPRVVVIATTLAAIMITGFIYLKKSKSRRTQREVFEELKIPSKWTKVGEVGELILYPLKGARRKCLEEAEFTKIGLREIGTVNENKLALQDRVFVVYNDKNEFVSLKKNSKMLKVEVSAASESTVRFTFPEEEDLIIEIPGNNDNTSDLHFYYGEKVKAIDCGPKAAVWFSHVLEGKTDGLRLGCFVESLLPPRSLQGAFEKQLAVYPKMHGEYLGAFSDMASYMLMSEGSLNDLNGRLDRPVSEHNFRPNILVKGCPAFSEDSWDWVRIGEDVVLRGFKYCTRCVVTTINPDTIEKDINIEPLRTLRTYRQVKEPELKKVEGNSPVMGLYLGCHRTGTVKLRDPVYVAV